MRHAGSSFQVAQSDKNFKNIHELLMIKYIEDNILAFADLNIVLSKINKLYWNKSLNKEIELIYPYFELKESNNNKSGEYGLVIGRVQPLKNPEVLFKAIEHKKPQNKILWIGKSIKEPKSEKNYVDFIREKYPLIEKEIIDFTGELSYQNTINQIAKSKYIIITSHWDTFNFTVIEAMMNKTIVICSSGVGASELIENGINGFVFKNDDYLDLSNAISTVESLSASEISNITTKAFECVKDKLNISTIQKRLELIEKAALNNENNNEILNSMINIGFKKSGFGLTHNAIKINKLLTLLLKKLFWKIAQLYR